MHSQGLNHCDAPPLLLYHPASFGLPKPPATQHPGSNLHKRKVLFFIGADWYFCSHRLQLARGLQRAGFEIVVLTHVRADGERIRSEGFRLIESSLQRASLNPINDIKSLFGTLSAYRAEKPDVAHHVGIKPILYGSLASLMTSTPAMVNAFAGTGYLFNSSDRSARAIRVVVSRFMKWLLNRGNARVLLQSDHARDVMVQSGMLRPDRIAVIRGSGVDLDEFAPTPEPPGTPLVVLPGRMLWDKGVGDFVKAAGILRQRNVHVRMALVGAPDVANPSAIPDAQLEAWRDGGDVEWWGHQADMPSVLAQSHIVCLPSYHEGVPKALIEGAASGRALIASDIPGCREVVEDGKNGLLVPPGDAETLANAIERLAGDRDLRQQLGNNGRRVAVENFSIESVVQKTQAIYEELLAACPA
ncbi:MAG TPA: glycosyltransferase family 4 protein [Gemmatimonadaceae bacterium]|nr:glycosyltransferase family 4 protein [Gemmatimonadaceae bacterium]